MEEDKGIEITPKDLIKRPDGMPLGGGKTGTGEGGFNLKGVQSILKEIKATIDAAKQIPGLSERLGQMFPELSSQDAGSSPKTKASSQGKQATDFMMVIQLLQAKYGDITINQVLERLKADFGNARLSDLTRGFK